MSQIEEGTLLWEPTESWVKDSNIYQYMRWLKKHKQLHFTNYDDLWQWSVDELETFWESIWEYFDIQSNKPYKTILTSHEMPGAKWFPEATINYTEHIFQNRDAEKLAIIHASEDRETTEITWGELYKD